MKHLRTVTGRDLLWVRPAALKRIYELRAGDTRVAELRFDRSIGWAAVGSAGEESWTLEQRGVLKSQITVSHNEPRVEVAHIAEKRGRSNQEILLADGSSYLICVDALRTRFTLETATGEPLFFLERRGFLRTRWGMEIRYRARANRNLPWLVVLLWYYALIQRRRSQK